MFFADTFKDKVVLVTGHTGFKGTWLVAWLKMLGAKVVGISKGLPSDPSAFKLTKQQKNINDYRFNISNAARLKTVINKHQPDFIFHLAAQAIVSTSYSDPVETIQTNAMGTVNILDAVKDYAKKCTVIMITSDKCYENVEWIWGYKETDKLGGKDIYSASKAAAEIVINGYYHSFLKHNKNIKLGIARAGNVIGGGDWAKDRLIVDCVKAWSQGNKVHIRSPYSTRPWQHVLEPLSGYLLLALRLNQDQNLSGEAFNFGPNSNQNNTIKEVTDTLSSLWGFKRPSQGITTEKRQTFQEAGLLKLNCDKSLALLDWAPTLSFDETLKMVADWYLNYYEGNDDINSFTLKQISSYENFAKQGGRSWTSIKTIT